MKRKRLPRALTKSGALDWPGQARRDYAFAKACVLERGQCAPFFAVHGAKRSVIVPAFWRNDTDKDDTARVVRLICVAEDADGLSFITEAWIRRMVRAHNESEAEFQARSNAIAPSKAEDRIEVVMANLTYREDDERKWIVLCGEIIRDNAGKPIRIADLTLDDETGNPGGRMFDILPEERPDPEARALARALIDAAEQREAS